MEDKFFHVYADGKRVREITRDTFRIWNRKYPNRMVVSIQNGYVTICQYETMKYLPLSQLIEVLTRAGCFDYRVTSVT